MAIWTTTLTFTKGGQPAQRVFDVSVNDAANASDRAEAEARRRFPALFADLDVTVLSIEVRPKG
jgi:hypothetical protein